MKLGLFVFLVLNGFIFSPSKALSSPSPQSYELFCSGYEGKMSDLRDLKINPLLLGGDKPDNSQAHLRIAPANLSTTKRQLKIDEFIYSKSREIFGSLEYAIVRLCKEKRLKSSELSGISAQLENQCSLYLRDFEGARKMCNFYTKRRVEDIEEAISLYDFALKSYDKETIACTQKSHTEVAKNIFCSNFDSRSLPEIFNNSFYALSTSTNVNQSEAHVKVAPLGLPESKRQEMLTDYIKILNENVLKHQRDTITKLCRSSNNTLFFWRGSSLASVCHWFKDYNDNQSDFNDCVFRAEIYADNVRQGLGYFKGALSRLAESDYACINASVNDGSRENNKEQVGGNKTDSKPDTSVSAQ